VKQVILIDGKGALYRFGYALKTLSTAEGKASGAIHGMMSGLLRLKRKFPGAQLLVVWDGYKTSESWRKALYPAYKGNRQHKADPVRDGILAQEKPIRELLDLLGVVQVSHQMVEADDIIGIVARSGVKASDVPIVYSGDKDFLQLMADDVKIIRDVVKGPDKLKFETPSSVRLEFRCEPSQVLSVRALAGDGSDNIPGVLKGVGVVGASKMVAHGVQPELKKWEENRLDARQAFPILKEQWHVVHRNYKLMKLPCVPDDGIFGAEVAHSLKATLDETYRQMEQEFPVCERDAIALLGDYELVELVSVRHELFKLGRNHLDT
jgi:5'-3' exonuclease